MFIMPVLFLVMLSILWMVPMKLEMQSLFYSCTSFVNSWASTEVFVVTLGAMMLELGTFAQYVVGDSCAKLDPWI